ncbi:MAG TPA: alpha/beta fold hydrolase [Polyangiaceae bacterium]
MKSPKAPLVLIHGFLGGPWSFDGVLSRLSSGPDVMCPALSFHGHGAESDSYDTTFLGEIDRIAANVVRRFGGAPVTLLGYSLGGRIALGLAIRHPSAVRRLILISSRRGLDAAEDRSTRLARDEAWATLLERSGWDAFLEAWWAQPVFSSLQRLPSEALEREAIQRRRGHPSALAMAMRRFSLGNQPDYATEVQNLAVPTLLVAGDLDPKFVGLSKELAELLPKGRVFVIENAGHHLLLEAPAAVARIIDEELER